MAVRQSHFVGLFPDPGNRKHEACPRVGGHGGHKKKTGHESALAACLAYVDLNPIRAKSAETPETSCFTSVYECVAALRATHETTAPDSHSRLADDDQAAPGRSTDVSENAARQPRPGWLSPFELSADAAQASVPRGRASNTGCLPMRFADYLDLLDWTGRQVRHDKRGAIPAELSPILERLQMNGDGWLDLVSGFSRLFRRSAGRPASLSREAEKRGRRRMPGIAASHAVFG